MSTNVVAQKYAQAVYEETYKNGKTGLVGQELMAIAKVMAPDFIQFFQNPFNKLEDKLTTVNQTFEGKVSAETHNILKLLVSKSRMHIIGDLSEELNTLIRNSTGQTRGKLFSPVEPTKEFISQVEAELSKLLNKKIELDFEKDESLIAGFKVQVGGWTIDDSASAHLNKIKEDLMKRGL